MSRLEKLHAPYFIQKVTVSSDLIGTPRFAALSKLCAGKKVLHIGCTDFPITNIQENLHIKLEPICAQLDGFDINTEAFDEMHLHLQGRLFYDWSQITEEYDLVLVPEVLEHVSSVSDFLRALDTLRTSQYVLTVPDAYSCFKNHFDYLEGEFYEAVHPDHNCWYSPYTFVNTIKKHTSWTIDWLGFYNNISLLMIARK